MLEIPVATWMQLGCVFTSLIVLQLLMNRWYF